MFDSGSILNDLLAELNASSAVASGNGGEDGGGDGNDDEEDVFALLERELTSSYYNNNSNDPSSSSTGAFVVNNQAPPGFSNVNENDKGGGQTVASSLGQYGLVSDFLAADASIKQQQRTKVNDDEDIANKLLFEQLFSNSNNNNDSKEEEYMLDDYVKDDKGGQGGVSGGLMTLLLSASSKNNNNNNRGAKTTTAAKTLSSSSSSSTTGTAATATAKVVVEDNKQPSIVAVGNNDVAVPPPSQHQHPQMIHPNQQMMMMPPQMMILPPSMHPQQQHMMMMHPSHQQLPPGGQMMYHPHLSPGGMSMPPHTMMMGQRGGLLPPHMGVLPPDYLPPRHQIDDEEFPVLGSIPNKKVSVELSSVGMNNNIGVSSPPPPPPPRPIVITPQFNNPNPLAPPINAHAISTKFMPPRDVCFIVHSMLRSLKSLDAYNDDYYHWSVIHKSTTNFVRGMGGIGTNAAVVASVTATAAVLPTPVWKEVKVIAQQRDDKYYNSIKARAANFADTSKSLGQLQRMNVHRPKALLSTPKVIKRDDDDDNNNIDVTGDSKYESSQLAERLSLWKARVTINKGYTALLSLMELRRLIQVNANATNKISSLMLDVKTYVDILHMSLGLLVTIDSTAGTKTIAVNDAQLASTLSLSKGRVLCARAIEDGILPHASACQLLPVALTCILSSSPSSSSSASTTVAADGEDRLLLALTSLIVLTNPVLDPAIFCRCMDVPIALLAGETTAATKETYDTTNTSMMMMTKKRDISMIACTRTRMNLLHALLSMGKDVCAKSSYSEEWLQREEMFGTILAAESQK